MGTFVVVWLCLGVLFCLALVRAAARPQPEREVETPQFPSPSAKPATDPQHVSPPSLMPVETEPFPVSCQDR